MKRKRKKEEKIEELLEFIQVYADSVETTSSARLSAKGARGLGDLCYARTEVERRAHEMQTFLRELRKLKKVPTNT